MSIHRIPSPPRRRPSCARPCRPRPPPRSGRSGGGASPGPITGELWPSRNRDQPITAHLDEDVPLDAEGGNEHVEGEGGEAVLLQEGHQEAETNEDHHVHVLEI